jgi:hypothetical protein
VVGTSTDYGLPMINKSLLKVANTPYTHFLLQAELKAIKQGLKHTQNDYNDGFKYQGYVNQDSQHEGPGILIHISG